MSLQAKSDERIRVVGKVPSGLPSLVIPASCWQVEVELSFAVIAGVKPSADSCRGTASQVTSAADLQLMKAGHEGLRRGKTTEYLQVCRSGISIVVQGPRLQLLESRVPSAMTVLPGLASWCYTSGLRRVPFFLRGGQEVRHEGTVIMKGF